MIKLIFGLTLTFKTENRQLVTAFNQVVLQNIKRFFEGAHLDAKHFFNFIFRL